MESKRRPFVLLSAQRRQWEKRDIYRQYPDAQWIYISLSLQKTSVYQAIFQTHPWHFISSVRISEQTYAGGNIMTLHSAIFSTMHGWSVLTEDSLAAIKYACGKGQRLDSSKFAARVTSAKFGLWLAPSHTLVSESIRTVTIDKGAWHTQRPHHMTPINSLECAIHCWTTHHVERDTRDWDVLYLTKWKQRKGERMNHVNN